MDFFPFLERFGLRRGKGEGKSIRQIPKRAISTFPWIRLIYQLEKLSLEGGSSRSQNLDASFSHAHYSFTQGSQTQKQNLLHSKWGDRGRGWGGDDRPGRRGKKKTTHHPCFARWLIQGPQEDSGRPKLENKATKKPQQHWQWLIQCLGRKRGWGVGGKRNENISWTGKKQ